MTLECRKKTRIFPLEAVNAGIKGHRVLKLTANHKVGFLSLVFTDNLSPQKYDTRTYAAILYQEAPIPFFLSALPPSSCPVLPGPSCAKALLWEESLATCGTLSIPSKSTVYIPPSDLQVHQRLEHRLGRGKAILF